MNLLARVHGSMQALGGLVEAGIGGGTTFYSGGSVAFIGIPVMVHGLDQFIAGMNTVITGEYRDTVTSQLLQATGISSDVAGFVDSGFSMVGTFGGTAILRAGQLVSSSFKFSDAVISDFEVLQGEKSFQGLTIAQQKNLFTSGAKIYDQKLTELAHSFSKHSGRYPEKWGKLKGPMNAWHDQGLKQLIDICKAPGVFIRVVDPKTGLTWIEKRLPDGRGIRLNSDASFKGFID
jgi:hypothetical protein